MGLADAAVKDIESVFRGHFKFMTCDDISCAYTLMSSAMSFQFGLASIPRIYVSHI